MIGDATGQRVAWGRAFGWGCFLACSWTWVIGMFFPVYLLVDFGVPGWVAFAIPNVVGAALVGWVWRRSGDSERFVAGNEGAMRTFSVVTILFHVSFLAWFLPLISRDVADGEYAYGTLASVVILVGAMLLGALGSTAWRRLGIAVYLLSLGAFIAASVTSHGQGIKDPTVIVPAHTLFALVLAWPALGIGFLVCPHLDLTLHRARQEAPGPTGTAAFIIGFGLLFLVMVVFTLFYSAGLLTASWSYYVVAHIAIQATFTTGAHFRELYQRGIVFPRRDRATLDHAAARRRRVITVAIFTFALIVAIMLGIVLIKAWIPDRDIEFTERLSDGATAVHVYSRNRRVSYEVFMSAYALLFPAWFWICVVIGRGASRRVRLIAWGGAMVIAGPLFAWGYLEQQFVWVLVAVGVMLIVGGIVRTRRA